MRGRSIAPPFREPSNLANYFGTRDRVGRLVCIGSANGQGTCTSTVCSRAFDTTLRLTGLSKRRGEIDSNGATSNQMPCASLAAATSNRKQSFRVPRALDRNGPYYKSKTDM